MRIAVALLVPEPVATEVEGLRRALGDAALDNVVPHITLAPPVNVKESEFDAVLAHVRGVAATTDPFTVTVGPVATFAPVNPTLYLSVADAAVVASLRNRIASGPLERPDRYPFVPHVTVAEEASEARQAAALAALNDYERRLEFRSVHVLRDHAPGPRRWNPIADAWFEPPLVVGRGGLPFEITTASIGDEPFDVPDGAEPVVVTARRDDEVLGVATGWIRDGEATIESVTGDRELEQQLRRAAARAVSRTRSPRTP